MTKYPYEAVQDYLPLGPTLNRYRVMMKNLSRKLISQWNADNPNVRKHGSSRTRGRASRSRAARCGMASRLIRCRVDGVGGGTSSAKNSPPAKGTGGPVHLCAHKVVPAAAAHEMHLIEFLLPVSPQSLVGGLFCGQMSHGHNLRFKWLVPLGSLALMAWRERRGRGPRQVTKCINCVYLSPNWCCDICVCWE